MLIQCFTCHKVVSNFVPDDTVFAAIALCPECLRQKSDDIVLAKGRLTAESEWLQKKAKVSEGLGWHETELDYLRARVKLLEDQLAGKM